MLFQRDGEPAKVAVEAQAHAVAAATWNTASESACEFVYYKGIKAPFLPVLTPPVAVSCAAQVKWLENTCLAADRGVEWDWMNWMHHVNVSPSPQASSTSDVADIFVRACGGVSCAGAAPAPAALIDASKTKYGAGSAKQVRFEDAINGYGANH